jgi:cell division protein FtsA
MSLFKFNQKHITLKDYFTSLDIGEHKISCGVGSFDRKQGKIKILYSTHQASQGIKSSHITHIEKLEDNLLNIIHNCEKNTKKIIKSAYVQVPSAILNYQKVHISLKLSKQFVKEFHLNQLLLMACQKNKDKQDVLIHVSAISYQLDQNQSVKNPLGLLGEELSADIILISANRQWIKNISNCLNRCQIHIDGFVCDTLASSLSICSSDEKELGVTLIDIGATHTSFASFLNGSMQNIGSIPIGGHHVTNDIARGLSVSLHQAERLKNFYGSLIGTYHDDQDHILVTQLGDLPHHTPKEPISKGILQKIIQARMDELFDYTFKNLKKMSIDPLCLDRFILCGGGSLMQGTREFFMEKTQKIVRLGLPSYGNASFACMEGLLYYGFSQQMEQKILKTFPSSFWYRFKTWLNAD